MKNHTTYAFTLVELTILLAIVGLLATIAVPNFRNAKTSASIADAREDMRIIAAGLEAYKLDQSTYPQMNPSSSSLLPLNRSGTFYLPTLERLTTPISYVSGNPTFIDRFNGNGEFSGPDFQTIVSTSDYQDIYQQYYYLARNSSGHSLWTFTEPPTWFMLESTGPDGIHYNMSEAMAVRPSNSESDRAFFSHVIYDPTNGTISKGSLWRVGGEPAGPGSIVTELIETANSSRVNLWSEY